MTLRQVTLKNEDLTILYKVQFHNLQLSHQHHLHVFCDITLCTTHAHIHTEVRGKDELAE